MNKSENILSALFIFLILKNFIIDKNLKIKE
jgi:hypothetical protein